VVDHRNLAPLGQFPDPGDDVLAAGIDHFPGTVAARQRGLFRGGRGPDQAHAQGPGPLAGDEPDTARGGMEQDRLVTLQPVGLAKQVLHRQALEHQRGGLLETYAVGDPHDPVGGHIAQIGIGANRALPVRHAVAGTQVSHHGANRFDQARSLESQAMRQGMRIQPRATIDIDEIQADRLLADADLVRRGGRHHHFFQPHPIRPAMLMNTDRPCLFFFFHRRYLRPRRTSSSEPDQTSMNSRQATTAIHITAVLFGLTGIFGELIQASATLITAGRAAFATVALLLFMARTGHRPVRPARRALPVLLAAGVLLAIHWTTFFVAVKTGGIAVATLGFASFPAFITLFEGFLFKERTRIAEWAVVALVTAGLALVAPSFDFSD